MSTSAGASPNISLAMIEYRPFRNTDPPALCEIWRNQPPLRAVSADDHGGVGGHGTLQTVFRSNGVDRGDRGSTSGGICACGLWSDRGWLAAGHGIWSNLHVDGRSPSPADAKLPRICCNAAKRIWRRTERGPATAVGWPASHRSTTDCTAAVRFRESSRAMCSCVALSRGGL